MSSSGGGIVVHPNNQSSPLRWFSKTDAQTIADCLSEHGHSDLASTLQAVIDASS